MKGYKKDGKFHPIRNKRSPSKNRKKKFENAKIQSLIFPKKGSNKFTNSTALAWASSHGFKAVKVEPTKNTLRIRQFSPNKIKRGTECKTIQFGGSGVQGVLCDTPERFKRTKVPDDFIRMKRDFVMSELDDFTLDRRIEMLQNAEMHVETVKQVDGVTNLEGIKKLLKESKDEKKNRTNNPKTQSQLRDFIAEKFNEEIPDQTFGFPFRDVNFRDIEKTGKNKWKFIIALASNDGNTVPQIERIGFKNLKINKILDTKWATFEGDLGLG